MNRTFRSSLMFTMALAFGGSAFAQNDTAIPGWYPLPDSLFLIWRLEEDQIRRLRVIEEDHNAERAEILADEGTSDRDQRLQQLAVERRREIKAVLQVKQFEDWERRSRTAGLR